MQRIVRNHPKIRKVTHTPDSKPKDDELVEIRRASIARELAHRARLLYEEQRRGR